jgi:hypothetical protein
MEKRVPLRANKKVSRTTGNTNVLKRLLFSIPLLLVLSGMIDILRPDICTCTGLSFACINVNSLNMSQANKPAQLRKLYVY